jgi:hypothetical protein
MSEEDRENDYPEGSLGWKINHKIDAIEAKPLKSGAVFMLLFVAFFTPALVEILLYPRSPFFLWRLGFDGFKLAQWNMVVYVVVLLMFAGAFLYRGVRLIWHGLRQRGYRGEFNS